MFDQLRNSLVRLLQPAAAAGGGSTLEVRNDTDVFKLTDLDRMMEVFNIKPAASGMLVNSKTSQRVSAVYACVRLIAGAIMTLPLQIYRRTDGDGREKQGDHPLWWLLNEQPTPRMSAAMAWDFVIGMKLLRGDGLFAIVRNLAAEITELIPLDRSWVTIERRGGRLVYFVSDPFLDKAYGLDQDDVLHFPGFGWTGIRGDAVISSGALQATGNALAMGEFSGKFFANGASPTMILEYPAKLDADAADRLRTLFAERYAGTDNAHKPMILTQGGKANQISIDPEKAQLLESRQYEVIDIARAFGVPPFMIGAMDKTTAWGSGIEQMSIAFVQYALMPHLVVIQQEINRKCFRTSRYFAEFNVAGLLRGDIQTRSKYYREMVGGSQGPGIMTINEVRRLENLPPKTGGEELYMPKSTTPPGNKNDPAQQ